MKKLLLVILLTTSPVLAAQDFLHACATKYNYKHTQILNSTAPKTYISCSIKEKLNIFTNEITSKGIEETVFRFAINKDKQVYYNGENKDGVALFDDNQIIFLTRDFEKRGDIDYLKVRYNIINRKTGVYESYFLEGWTSLNRTKPNVYEGKGTGNCIIETENKF